MEKITRKHWKSLTKQVMFKLDLTVCRQHWMRACLSPNRAPGQTVVPFSQFTTALVYAKRWKKGDMKAVAICKAIMSTAFPFQHKAGVEYNPLPLEVQGGNVHQYICEGAIKAHIEQMGEMELTAENCYLAAFDLQAIARYYTETIIDAAKTGKIVVIENIDNFDRKKERSRQDLEFSVDWNTRAMKEAEQMRHLAPGQSFLNDVFEDLRKGAMKTAEEAVHGLAQIEQEFSPKTREWVNKTALDPECKKYILFCKRMKEVYWSLNTIKKAYEAMLDRGISDSLRSSSIFELQKKGVKEAYNAAFDHLRDQLRWVLKNVNPIHRVALLLYVTFLYRDPGQTKKQISAYAQQTLEEEFFQFVLMMYKHDLDVPKYTEDELEEVHGFYDYESDEERTVDFLFGQYESDDGKRYAFAKNPNLDGEYIVRKNTHNKWVASRVISELVKVPVPQERTLTFITKMGEDLRTEQADKDGAFDPGKTITLIPQLSINGDTEDAVVVDGKSVTEFRCDYPEMIDVEGKPYPPVKGSKTRWINDPVTRALYTHMQGEVCGVVGAKIPGNRGRDQYIAIVTLKNVRKVVDVKVTETTKGKVVAKAAAKPAARPAFKASVLDGAKEA